MVLLMRGGRPPEASAAAVDALPVRCRSVPLSTARLRCRVYMIQSIKVLGGRRRVDRGDPELRGGGGARAGDCRRKSFFSDFMESISYLCNSYDDFISL